MELRLEPLASRHRERFIEAALRSQLLHNPWVSSPTNNKAFAELLDKHDRERNLGFVIKNRTEQLVAWISLSEIARGNFQSAYLGYYVFVPFDACGLMAQAMRLVIQYAFAEMGLHRLEANIQPENRLSIQLVRGLGFRLEGRSERYLKIQGEWKDHLRYAITAEEFK